MKCPQCNNLETGVIDSREADESMSVRRRRECGVCEFRFTTYERIERARLMVVKRDESRELYDRAKLAAGVHKAFYKRPASASEIEQLLDEIEREIFEQNTEEVPSTRIGELIMQRLEAVDSVAYIRFAAVYRQFKDLSTFDQEIKKLINKKAISK